MKVEAVEVLRGKGLMCTVLLDTGEDPAVGDILRRVSDGKSWSVREIDGPVALVERGATVGALMGLVFDEDAGVAVGDRLGGVTVAHRK